jgi:hypothetical protein
VRRCHEDIALHAQEEYTYQKFKIRSLLDGLVLDVQRPRLYLVKRDALIAHIIRPFFKVVSKGNLTFVIVQIYLLIFGIAFLDEVFPFAPTIIIAVRVKYVQVAKLLELIESVGTKEVHANLPDYRPHTHILTVIRK